jgi:hypothetical protein
MPSLKKTNAEFIAKLNRMFKGVIEVVETERDCFELKAVSPWLRDDQQIFLSDDLIEMVKVWFLRNAGKKVVFNNTKTIFWLADAEAAGAIGEQA